MDDPDQCPAIGPDGLRCERLLPYCEGDRGGQHVATDPDGKRVVWGRERNAMCSR